MSTIVRLSLREQVQADIADRLVRGDLRGGPVNEVELAAQLGVSRTPVREALMALEVLGLLQRRATGGFEALPLRRQEVLDLYPMIAALEGLALASADPVALAAEAPALRTLADAVVKAAKRGPDRARQADDAFHDRLVAAAGNDELRRTLGTIKTRLLRYEHAFMTDLPSVEESRRQHHAIVDAVARRDIAAARSALEENWRHTMDHLLEVMGDE